MKNKKQRIQQLEDQAKETAALIGTLQKLVESQDKTIDNLRKSVQSYANEAERANNRVGKLEVQVVANKGELEVLSTNKKDFRCGAIVEDSGRNKHVVLEVYKERGLFKCVNFQGVVNEFLISCHEVIAPNLNAYLNGKKEPVQEEKKLKFGDLLECNINYDGISKGEQVVFLRYGKNIETCQIITKQMNHYCLGICYFKPP